MGCVDGCGEGALRWCGEGALRGCVGRACIKSVEGVRCVDRVRIDMGY